MVPFTVDGLSQIINQVLPEPHAGLLAGLMFGTKASLPSDLYDALVTSGTLHIVALSGMNISILSRMTANTLIRFIGKRAASGMTLLLIAWFVWFVGPSPSIVRAGIMGGTATMALLFGRQYWAILSWGLAVGIMLVVNISWLTDISFQLSALATLGIILFGGDAVGDPFVGTYPAGASLRQRNDTVSAGSLTSSETIDDSIDPDIIRSCMRAYGNLFRPSPHKHVSGVLGYLRILISDNLRLTLAAQTLTIPLILWYFHRISLISPVANLAIGWVIAPLTGLGWMTVLVGYFVLSIGQIVGWIDWLLLEYLVRTVYFMSSIPGASLGQ